MGGWLDVGSVVEKKLVKVSGSIGGLMAQRINDNERVFLRSMNCRDGILRSAGGWVLGSGFF